MAILPIRTYEDSILRKETEPVKKNSDALQKLIDDMFETMHNAEGVGLAAPQIGRSLQLFVAHAGAYDEQDPSHKPLTMINPKITVESNSTVTMEEGCLSIPDVMGPVVRPEEIVVNFKDRQFDSQELEIEGQLARIIQHEIDHLNGVLFVDHLSFFKRKLVSSKLKALADGKKEINYPVVPKANA